MRFQTLCKVALTALLVPSTSAVVTADLTSQDSISKAAGTLAKGLVSYYKGNEPGHTPGLLPQPYYWWETGAMMNALIDYWFYTGDSQYNKLVTQGMLHQVGPNNDYMPPNRTKDLGNDDQGFWGMTAIAAAEAKFPDPPKDQPQWLALAQAVINGQISRWDTTTCGGGLKWQVFAFNNGYNYKNTISNGCFFNMLARVGRYTGNTTYLEWAEKVWDWGEDTGLWSHDYHFYDGSDDKINCTQINHIEWSYNIGVFMYGAAAMWNVTQSPKWEGRLNGILKTVNIFFKNGVMKEVACEDAKRCDVDQRSFRAYLSRWMGHTTKVAPFTASTIMALIKSSSTAALKTCSGGADGIQCGMSWSAGQFDGDVGVGEQMSALEVVQANLAPYKPGPVTAKTGGTSQGDPNAGMNSNIPVSHNAITGGDRAGAGILTTLVLISMFGGSWWMASK